MKNFKLDFEKFGEKRREYDANTLIYQFKNNVNIITNFIVVFDGEDIGGKILMKGFKNKRCIVNYNSENMTINCKILKPYKRTYIEGNYNEYVYSIECVGNKRPTTHLPAGLLFQLKLIK